MFIIIYHKLKVSIRIIINLPIVLNHILLKGLKPVKFSK